MTDPILSSAFEVTNARGAAIFSDPLRRQIVLLLAAQPRSIGELAAHMEFDLKRLHYHVNVLVDLGLVIIKRKRSRAGRAIKVYGTIASAFFVRANASIARPAVALNRELSKLLEEHAQQAGTLFFSNQRGEAKMRPVFDASSRRGSAVEVWRILKLTRTELMQITSAIEGCVKSVQGAPKDRKQTYLMHFAIAPRSNYR